MHEVVLHRLANIAERLDAPAGAATFMADVVAGLSARPKHLPAKYFYDAAGSALFEQITRLPEYYPTRAEISILLARGDEIGALVPRRSALIEFGSGSSTKIRILLDHLRELAVYVPVDVSGEMLSGEADALRRDFSQLNVHPVVGDFTRRFSLPPDATGRPRVGFFPGSTIGNFDRPQAAAFLAHARDMLGHGSLLILGVDLIKDEAVLNAAYDDAAGVTARFNLNMLARINREMGANIVLRNFAHRAFFNTRDSRIEMHLVSRVRQDVEIGAHHFTLERGETIHTENSYKYTIDGFQRLACRAGWMPRKVWTDPDNLFSVHVLSG